LTNYPCFGSICNNLDSRLNSVNSVKIIIVLIIIIIVLSTCIMLEITSSANNAADGTSLGLAPTPMSNELPSTPLLDDMPNDGKNKSEEKIDSQQDTTQAFLYSTFRTVTITSSNTATATSHNNPIKDSDDAGRVPPTFEESPSMRTIQAPPPSNGSRSQTFTSFADYSSGSGRATVIVHSSSGTSNNSSSSSSGSSSGGGGGGNLGTVNKGWSSGFLDRGNMTILNNPGLPAPGGRLSELEVGTTGDINPSILSRSGGLSTSNSRRKLSNAVGDNSHHHHPAEEGWKVVGSPPRKHLEGPPNERDPSVDPPGNVNSATAMTTTTNINVAMNISPALSSASPSSSYSSQPSIGPHLSIAGKPFTTLPESYTVAINEFASRPLPPRVHATGYPMTGLTPVSPLLGPFPISTLDGVFDMNNDSSDSSLGVEVVDAANRDGLANAYVQVDSRQPPKTNPNGFTIMGRVQSHVAIPTGTSYRLSTSDVTHDISSGWLRQDPPSYHFPQSDFKELRQMSSQVQDFMLTKPWFDRFPLSAGLPVDDRSPPHEDSFSSSIPPSHPHHPSHRLVPGTSSSHQRHPYYGDIEPSSRPSEFISTVIHRYSPPPIMSYDEMNDLMMTSHDSNDRRSKDVHSPSTAGSPGGAIMEEDYMADLALLARETFDYSHRYVVEFKSARRDVFVSPVRYRKDIRLGDLVIVEADRGKDMGKVIEEFDYHRNATTDDSGQEVKRIYRLAQPNEAEQLVAKTQDELKTLAVCQAKVRQKRLPMEVVDAEYQWDRRKLTFYFIAQHRIDFRELVRDLFKLYKTRIWMCAVDETRTHHFPSQSS
jgi:hypothetical protein